MESNSSSQSNSIDRYSISAPRQKSTPSLLFETRRLKPTDYELLEILKLCQQNYDNPELVSNPNKDIITSKNIQYQPIRRDCVIEVEISQ